MLDTKVALAPLSVEEMDHLRGIHAELCASVADEAAIKRQRHVSGFAKQIVRRGEDASTTPDLVERLLDADARGVLSGRHLLRLDDGRVVTVRDILADREAFHRATCAEPLDPNMVAERTKPSSTRMAVTHASSAMRTAGVCSPSHWMRPMSLPQ